jgi:Nucleotidyl transferase AbiEii toxin, Type IV TA system
VSVLDGHLRLFKLAWVSNPELLRQQAAVTGVKDPYVAEMAAWCMELHTQFNELAEELGMPLLLMGGTGAALRVEVAKQRGSADNDYLTNASRTDIAAPVEAFRRRFADIPSPFFEPELINYTGDEPLPLMSYQVTVPKLYGANPVLHEQLMVKVEFHIEEDLPLPPSEELNAESGAVGQKIRATVPLVPYQIGLKLMTLVEPPVGIDPDRDGSVPRQIYDVDALFQQITRPEDWQAVHDYTDKRYGKELRQRHLRPRADSRGAAPTRDSHTGRTRTGTVPSGSS